MRTIPLAIVESIGLGRFQLALVAAVRVLASATLDIGEELRLRLIPCPAGFGCSRSMRICVSSDTPLATAARKVAGL
jgi:hypothetical protein